MWYGIQKCAKFSVNHVNRQGFPCGLRVSFKVGHRGPWPRQQQSLHSVCTPPAEETLSQLPALAPRFEPARSHCPRSCWPPPAADARQASWRWCCPGLRCTAPWSRDPERDWRQRCWSPDRGRRGCVSLRGWLDSPSGHWFPGLGRNQSASHISMNHSAQHLWGAGR